MIAHSPSSTCFSRFGVSAAGLIPPARRVTSPSPRDESPRDKSRGWQAKPAVANLQNNQVYPPGGFKSATSTQNLMNQVAGGSVNRLQPVWCISSGINPAPKYTRLICRTAKAG
jgi:hypothetical protein